MDEQSEQDFSFSAPCFHDFNAKGEDDDVDESYFDPRRSSHPEKILDDGEDADEDVDENPYGYAVIQPDDGFSPSPAAKVQVEHKPVDTPVVGEGKVHDGDAAEEDVVVDLAAEAAAVAVATTPAPAADEAPVVFAADGEEVNPAEPAAVPSTRSVLFSPPAKTLQPHKTWAAISAPPVSPIAQSPSVAADAPKTPAMAAGKPEANTVDDDDDDDGYAGAEAVDVTNLDTMLCTVPEDGDVNPCAIGAGAGAGAGAGPCATLAATAAAATAAARRAPTAGLSSTPSYLKATASFRMHVENKKRKNLSSPAPAAAVVAKPPELTMPKSPVFQSLKRTRSAPKFSTTTLELQKIMAERAQLKAQQKSYQAMYEKIHSGVANPIKAMPARSTKPLTMPEEPHFRTEERVKGVAPKTPYKPVAQQVQEFQTKTPARYHTGPRKTPSSASRGHAPRVTTPVPFKFATEEAAKRHAAPMSTAEMEELMMKSMPKFKARPVNHKVLAGAGDAGVPKMARKELTQPMPFTLKSESRHRRAVEQFTSQVQAEEAKTKAQRRFKAQGVMQPTAAPRPAPKPATKVVAKPLPSDLRAISRAEYEAERKRRKEAAAAAKAAAKAAADAKAAAEVKSLRRKMSFKAKPFTAKAAPPPLPRAAKDLTCPLTPRLRTNQRATQRGTKPADAIDVTL